MRFEHAVSIAAPPATVWSVMSDLASWPTWTGTVTGFRWIKGDRLAEGAVVHLETAGSPAAFWRVTEVRDGESFTWEATTRGVTTVASHHLEANGDGTVVTLALEQRGLAALLFRPLIARVARRNLAREAEGLKRASEARSRTPA